MAERRVGISLKTSWSWGSGSFAQRRYRQALRAVSQAGSFNSFRSVSFHPFAPPQRGAHVALNVIGQAIARR